MAAAEGEQRISTHVVLIVKAILVYENVVCEPIVCMLTGEQPCVYMCVYVWRPEFGVSVLCESVCVYVHMKTCTRKHAHVYACVWRPEVSVSVVCEPMYIMLTVSMHLCMEV